MSQRNYLWEACSAYFVNTYYTDIYNSSKAHNMTSSLTDSYRDRISSYIKAIKSIESSFRRLCSDLHRFVTRSSRFQTLMYGEFVDRLVQDFTPSEYYQVLTKVQKDEMFSSIINDIASTLGSYCVSPSMLKKIIDDHSNKIVNQEIIYRECLSIMKHKRESLLHSFVKNISQAKDTVPVAVVDELRDTIEILNKEINNLRSIISDLECDLEDYEEREEKYKKIISLLQKTKITIHKQQQKQQQQQQQQQQHVKKEKVTTNELTINNLQKHNQEILNNKLKTDDNIKDESEDESEDEDGELVNDDNKSNSNSNSKESSLDSNKKDLVDNIDGLLLTD